jgi:PAS domain S-box-containing protein
VSGIFFDTEVCIFKSGRGTGIFAGLIVLNSKALAWVQAVTIQSLVADYCKHPIFGLFHAHNLLICCAFTQMSNVVEPIDRTSVTPKRAPSLSPLVVLCAFVLTVATAFSLWVYVHGTRAIRVQAKVHGIDARPNEEAFSKLLQDVDGWALRLTLATAGGGAGVLLVTLLGVSWWRRSLLNRLAGAQESSRRFDHTNYELQKQTAERKRLEGELRRLSLEMDRRVEERTSVLTQTYTKLEEELNERKQAEKALAQQAQELERSKDVLELHVQARTQELQKLQRRYEHILNSAGEGIYGLDLQGRTTFVNPAAAKITGWKVDDLIGKYEHEVFHRTQPSSNTALLARNGEYLSDQVFYRKDGSNFPVEYVKTAILEKEKLVGAVVVFKDITERKRTEDTLARKAAELSRSNAELEQFAYVASHDLQEPLRKIQAFGDRLKSKCDAVQLQEGRDYLERMQNAAARMQTLINDLLTFSRVISTTQPFVPVDLAVVTGEVLTDLEVRIEQTKAKIEVGNLPTIEADPLQMRQLLQNLIGNALKFQAPSAQPVVNISAQIVKRGFGTAGGTEPVDELCELSIQDNGIGFEEKYKEKIFAVFQRLHGRNEFEGTGVGLAVCRRITDRHGGTITAHSKLGEGATFVVTLPVKHPKAEEAA